MINNVGQKQNSKAFKKLCFVFAVFLFFSFRPSDLFSCSLAMHEWKLAFHSKLALNGPIFPFSEVDLLVKGEFEPVKSVLWVTPGASDKSSLISSFFVPVYQSILSSIKLEDYMGAGLHDTLSPNRHKNFNWTKTLAWMPFSNGGELGRIQDYLTSEDYIVIGSDNYSLRVALFSDINSNNECHQLVIMQEGRIRAVQPSVKNPSANESKGLAYISLVFYGNPVNGDILSFSFHPIAGTRCFFMQNEELVVKLIEEKKLLPRISAENDPSSYDIPELPQ